MSACSAGRWRDMASMFEPSDVRYVRVRIADVPLSERIRAAASVSRDEDDPRVRVKVFDLALDPGDLTAYIRP